VTDDNGGEMVIVFSATIIDVAIINLTSFNL